MKKQISLWIVVLLMPWVVTTAQATSVTVDISATIMHVEDPYGVVPEIIPGDTLLGQYTYETNTYDLDSWPEMGYYLHLGGTGHLSFTAGPYQVVTDTSGSNPFHISIDDEYNPGMESFSAYSGQLLPSNGATFNYALMSLQALNNSALQSADLTEIPPDPSLFNVQRRVEFSGQKDGQYFYVLADMMPPEVSQPAPETRRAYQATAVVTHIEDPSGVLAGKLSLGGSVTAGFLYDTAVPNVNCSPDKGVYMHAPGAGAVNVAFSGVLLESDPAAYGPEVHVADSVDPQMDDYMMVGSKNMLSNDSALTVQSTALHFYGLQTLYSNELPTAPLSLVDWGVVVVHVEGDGWFFNAELSSLDPAPVAKESVVTLFPGDGAVHPLQLFGAVLRVNDQPLVTGITGTVNGQDISAPLANCSIEPMFETTQSVVCPDMQAILMPGDNLVRFHLMLDGGGVVETEANWALTP